MAVERRGDYSHVTTVHIAPNATSAAAIRAALNVLGDQVADVVTYHDDLSCGPIGRGDRRAWWMATFTGDMGRDCLCLWNSLDADLSPLAADDPDAQLIAWVGRRSAQEYANYLFLTDRFRTRPLYTIEVTGPADGTDGGGVVSALAPGEIGAYLKSERLLGDNEHHAMAEHWTMLCAEEAPFRVVSESALVSAPIDQFDNSLLAHIDSKPKPMTQAISEAMAEHRFQVADYVLQQRLITLIDTGAIGADGDPTTARLCRIQRIGQ
ncbi:DUF3658 domain-containing protein [Nocardia sp. NPDC046473]|uniref:DUF3658 domain-containing protein n=1 Tax=Nocardia sp. NPDC046473 TaxID=3155733 RepID=UPI0033D33C91